MFHEGTSTTCFVFALVWCDQGMIWNLILPTEHSNQWSTTTCCSKSLFQNGSFWTIHHVTRNSTIQLFKKNKLYLFWMQLYMKPLWDHVRVLWNFITILWNFFTNEIYMPNNDIFYVDFKLAISPMEKTAKCHVDTVKMEKYVIA